MAFRVEISLEAQIEADSILEWLLSQYAGEPGFRWFQGLVTAVESLANFPERCSLAPENSEFPFEVRHMLYGRKPHIYRVVFTIREETVYVIHIWHGRRKPVAPN